MGETEVLSKQETESGSGMSRLEITDVSMSQLSIFTDFYTQMRQLSTVYGEGKSLLRWQAEAGQTSAPVMNPAEILWKDTEDTTVFC